jgi:adenylylsulfate kinase
MTGVTDPYEAPIKPDLEIITDNETIEVSLQKIMGFITLKTKRNNE